MDEARASWNTVYQSKEGFECQITLRDEDETSLNDRTNKVIASITKSGGVPLKRRNHQPDGTNRNNGQRGKGKPNNSKSEKTYIDESGKRCCNIKLKTGKICGFPVTRRQGRYGSFWSCPNYKEHAE